MLLDFAPWTQITADWPRNRYVCPETKLPPETLISSAMLRRQKVKQFIPLSMRTQRDELDEYFQSLASAFALFAHAHRNFDRRSLEAKRLTQTPSNEAAVAWVQEPGGEQHKLRRPG